jgi:hypothetical protein
MIAKKDQPDQPRVGLALFAEQYDEFLQTYFVYFLVQVLNLSCYGTYIFSVFLTIFWLMSLLIFNKLKIFEM